MSENNTILDAQPLERDVITEREPLVINQVSGVEWGEITGEIQNQTDLAAVFASYADEIDKKVNNDGAGVSGALNQLNFNSNEITDETQLVVQNDATSWVRRKFSAVYSWLHTKIFAEFVSTKEQQLTREQRVQARANIKAAAGGNRTLAQTAEQGFVDLRGYTSSENAFTTPCDGYLQIRKAGTSGTAYLHVDNYTLSSSINGQTATIFCGQGMKVWVDNSPSGASFIPWLVQE